MKLILLVLAWVWLSSPAWALLPLVPNGSDKKPIVILVSMDGFRADYWDKTDTPHFHQLMKEGVLADHLKPVFPSVTFVNHYSIVTGLYSENHGIINNTMWDPVDQKTFEITNLEEVHRSDWWEGEPIWVTAEKQGLKTASIYWVGASTEIQKTRPTYWKLYDPSVSRAKRVEQVLEWLDLPEIERPQFITLYFEDADNAGHAFGPNSDEVKKAIKNLDESVGLLREGLKKRGLDEAVTLILVSDHGMAQVERAKAISLGDYIKSSEAKMVGQGALSLVWPKSSKEQNLILNRVKQNPGHFQVFTKETTPPRFHFSKHRRIPPLTFVAEEGWYLKNSIKDALKPGVFGLHGYDNTSNQMQAVFLAKGPTFPKNKKVGEVENIDIYALLAHVLHLKPAKTDGDLSRIIKVLDKKQED